MPRPPLRRSRVKARIAAAHATVRVLEQELRAASSALSLGQGDMASCAAYVGRDASRYFSGKPGLLQVLSGVGLMSSKFMAPDHTASKSEPGSVRGLS